MALPTYDSAKHHIGLKDRGGATNYGFMLSGGHSMSLQREAIGAPDLGGATDLIGQTPSMSRVTQDDFTGGMGAWQWGRDDGMFSDCTGFMPDMQNRHLLSCPPMFLKGAFDPDTKTGFVTDTPRNMFIIGGSIYVVWSYGIMRYQIATGTITWAGQIGSGDDFLDADGTARIIYADYDPGDQNIWMFVNDSTAGASTYVRRVTTTLSSPAVSSYAGPILPDYNGYGMAIFDKNLVVQIANKIWYGDLPDNPSAASATIKWTKIGRIPGRWKDHVEYNGMIYILHNDGGSSPTFRSRISAFDGTAIMPIAVMPHSFMGKCMVEYGGRIFIGGTGTDVNGGEHYAELYEMTGNSLRLVRSFSPETRRQLLSTGDWPNAIDDLAVHEGLLWFSQHGKRVCCYDITSDGFFGGSEILANTDLKLERIISGRGRLWAWGTDPSDDTKHGIYRIAQPADLGSGWNPTLVTSDFIYEPAMKKRWSEFRVMTRYGPVESLDYSLDSGTTWTALSFSSSSPYAPLYHASASLAAITPTENIRFRIKLDADTPTNAVTYHRELIAWTLSFAMLDTGKLAWSLTVNGSEEIETLDAELEEGTVQAYDTGDLSAQIKTWAVSKSPLTFTDTDGTAYDVQIVGYTRTQPLVSIEPTGETAPEAHHVLQLLEI